MSNGGASITSQGTKSFFKFPMVLALLFAAPVLFGAGSVLFTWINNEDCDTKSDEDCDKLEYFDFSKTWPAGFAGFLMGEVILAYVVSAYRFFNSSDSVKKGSDEHGAPYIDFKLAVIS